MNAKWLLKAVLLFIGLVCAAASSASGRSESVRVALIKGVDEVRIDGSGLLAADGNGNPVPLELPCTIRRNSDKLLVSGGRSFRRLTVSAPEKIRINGKNYRGIFDFYPSDKGVLVVNELPIEEYLVGLINCEISSLWPIEAIKSQAVIARSYAIYQKDARRNALYHLESSVMDQVYDGVDIEDSRAARGVRETEGEVLVASGAVIQAFYHSSCGGHTEAAHNVWGADVPYLQGVECRYCLSAPSINWEAVLPLKKIESQLRASGYQLGAIADIKAGKPNRSGRLQDVTIAHSRGELLISGVNFRKAVGYAVIKSTNMTIRIRGDEAVFSGLGNGHGVGLCQWGAKQRAADGFNYREILSSYYPGVKVEKLKY
ncbi:MAG: SpoIID/LytB domain-containing protein [Geobacter sp.]|nr:SpoIID/LytB domain-containing protein [Geobacter sp.]